MSEIKDEKIIKKRIAELSIALPSDIEAIDKCNRVMLKENYDQLFYHQIFDSGLSCSFVIRVGEKPQEEDESPSQLTQEKQITVAQKPLQDSEFAGYILAIITRDNKGRTTCHILSLAVYHAFQRQGFANVLMQSVESFVKERFPSVHHFVLHVRKHNKAAYNLYTKLQYNRGRKEKNYYKNPKEDGYEMTKPN